MNDIRITYPRFSYLIPVPFLLLLIGVSYWAGFVRDDDEKPVALFILVIAICLVGSFLLVYFIRQLFKNPIILLANETGFEYNPAGISTGFIPWQNVAKVEELSVRATNGSGIGAPETALGVWLNQPDDYYRTKQVALRKLMMLSEKQYGATILIQPSSLGKKYEQVWHHFLTQSRVRH